MSATDKTGDYCTLFPDRLGNKDWSKCCKAHDLAYSTEQPRATADKDLAICVAQETSWDGLALLMLVGVTLFGWLFRKHTDTKRKTARPTSEPLTK